MADQQIEGAFPDPDSSGGSIPKRGRGRPAAPKPKETLWDILQEIEKEGKVDGKVTLYRGHSSYRHKLRPSIFRDSNAKIRVRERSILRELIARHPREFSEDQNTFENLVRMQHYDLPTRLLDLTYNPLVATYFACEKDTNEHAEVVSLTVDLEKFKFFDADTVHCIANLANLTPAEQREIAECRDDALLRESDAGQRLFDFIVQRRPNFSARIVWQNLSDFFVVSPKLNNPRIIAQSGAFLIFGIVEELKSARGFNIKKIRIHKDHTPRIRNSLDMLGINHATIYPSLESTAKQIRDKYI